MEAKEALEILRNRDMAGTLKYDQAIDVAKDALERRIPREPRLPRRYEYKPDEGMCPRCGAILNEFLYYCKHCGQAVEW